jgi:hypothetical protein
LFPSSARRLTLYWHPIFMVNSLRMGLNLASPTMDVTPQQCESNRQIKAFGI